ncbi:MAG: hypothetical protein AAFV54_16705, partial [Pseudomonadota bacterium]
ESISFTLTSDQSDEATSAVSLALDPMLIAILAGDEEPSSADHFEFVEASMPVTETVDAFGGFSANSEAAAPQPVFFSPELDAFDFDVAQPVIDMTEDGFFGM